MRLALRIAWQFLKSSKSQTILITVGIAVGISVQLFISLLIQGLQADLIDNTVGYTSHITFEQEEYLEQDSSLYMELTQDDNFTVVSQVLQQNVFLINGDEENTIIANGIDFNNDVSNIKSKITTGNIPTSDNELLISSFYENISVGDKVTIFALTQEPIEYVVSGTFESGVSSIDEKFVYMNMSSLQGYLSLENRISKIETQIDEIFNSQTIKEHYEDGSYTITTWQETNESLLSALSSQSMSSYIIQVFVIISVALAISSVLIISVVQKSKQIGILKAMGLKNKGFSFVFIFQGAILGAIGAILGIIFGVSLLKMFTIFATNTDGEPVINIVFNSTSILISFAVGFVSSVVASVIPAYKSRKLTAIEVISNG